MPQFSLKKRMKCLLIKTFILFRQTVRQSLSYSFANKGILHLSLLQFCKKIQNSYFPPNLFLQLIMTSKIKLEMYSNFRSTTFPETPSSECFSLCAIMCLFLHNGNAANSGHLPFYILFLT